MSETNKILIGKIVAAQGIRGELRVQTYTESPVDLKNLNIIFDKKLNFIRAMGNDIAIIKIDGIDNRSDAEKLRGMELFIDRDALPATAADEFYQADLIGMDVIGYGRVAAVHNFGAGDILELDDEQMILFAGADVDLKNRTIKI